MNKKNEKINVEEKKDDIDNNYQNDDFKELKSDNDNNKLDYDNIEDWDLYINEIKSSQPKEIFNVDEKKDEETNGALEFTLEFGNFCQLLKDEEDKKTHVYNQLNERELEILE